MIKLLQSLGSKQTFFILLVISTGIKLVLAKIFPITGDEAYFVVWAENLDYGFYDHPPFVAWLIYPMLFFGKTELLIRLPVIGLSLLTCWIIFLMTKNNNREKAYFISILYLVSPINLLYIFISTDTANLFFSFLSGIFFYQAYQHNKYRYFLLSGICLGLAFLSKYFAVLLGLIFLIYFIFHKPLKKFHLLGFLLLFISTLPLIAVNLYWNYKHSWENILFNFINRHDGFDEPLTQFLVYLLTLIYLFSPPVIYYLIRSLRWKRIKDQKLELFVFILGISILFFTFMAYKTYIGLHWILSYFTFSYLLIFAIFNRVQLFKSIWFMGCFSGFHLIFVFVLLFTPLESFKKYNPYFHETVYFKHTKEILSQIKELNQDYHLSAFGYTVSAMNAFYVNRPFSVFHYINKIARQDDLITDYKKLDQDKFLIFLLHKDDFEQYGNYFLEKELFFVSYLGEKFYYMIGKKFQYALYRENVLQKVREKYYQIPAYLPQESCSFCKKYSLP